MSECVTRRCDDTVDKKRVNSGLLKRLFLEGGGQPKNSPKTPGNALSHALLMSRAQNFVADAAHRAPHGFDSSINSNQFGAKDPEKFFNCLLLVIPAADFASVLYWI